MDRRRQRHNAALNKVCTICGRGYTAKGIDTMYCGAACKQKAYKRGRQKSDKQGTVTAGPMLAQRKTATQTNQAGGARMKIAEYKKLIPDTRKMLDRTNGGSFFRYPDRQRGNMG